MEYTVVFDVWVTGTVNQGSWHLYLHSSSLVVVRMSQTYFLGDFEMYSHALDTCTAEGAETRVLYRASVGLARPFV